MSLFELLLPAAARNIVPAGVAAFAVAFGLVVYDSWFLLKTRTLR